LPVGLGVFAGQTPGAAGDANRIERIDAEPLNQLAQRLLKTMVEAPDNGGVALVSFPWRLEMENLANGGPRSAHSRAKAAHEWEPGRIIIAGEILICL
jgi:hypothetical protein